MKLFDVTVFRKKKRWQINSLRYFLVKWSESRSVVSDFLWPHGLYSPWNALGQNTGVGSLSLLQGIFPTQGSNPGLSHCRQILYQLSHKGSPESEEELKSLLMKVKGESENAGLTLNIQKMKIMASSPITSWPADGGKVETVTFYFLGHQNHHR